MVTLEVEVADSLDVANDGNPEEYQDCEEYRADMVPPPPPPLERTREEVLDEAEGKKDDEEMPSDDSNYVSSEEVDGFDLLRDDVM